MFGLPYLIRTSNGHKLLDFVVQIWYNIMFGGMSKIRTYVYPLRFQQLRRLSRYHPIGDYTMNCLFCNKETTNPKYCSKSCSAKHTNTLYPKRKTKKKCIICGDSVLSYRHNRCEKHHKEYKENIYKSKTLGEYRNRPSVKGKHPSWVNVHIRRFARSWHKHLTTEPCRHCGYTKHVELAHINAVVTFPDSALLSDVNSLDNVIPLCPNCHWEFDNLPR